MYTATMSYRNIYLPFRLFSSGKNPPLKSTDNDLHKVMLASAIESIYTEEWKIRGVYPFQKDYLQMRLLKHDTYTLSPIDCYVLKISDLPKFVYNLLVFESKRGIIWIEESYQGDENLIAVFQCRDTIDSFLMTAFSQLLLKRICDVYEVPITTNGTSLHDLRCKHYEFLNRQRNVVKLIKIDLSPCMKQVSNKRILSSFDNKFCQGIVFNLAKQILFLPIYDDSTGKIIPNDDLVPQMGEITHVIFHHFYQIVFDQVLEYKYPGITYSRWVHEVFIAIKKNESFSFEDDSVISLLDEIDIDGEFYYQGCEDLGCLPASGGEKAVLLHEDGDVAVWRFEDI